MRAIAQMDECHRMDVARFSSYLHLAYLVEMITELEYYFDLQYVKDLNMFRLVQTRLKGHSTCYGRKSYKRIEKIIMNLRLLYGNLGFLD